MMKINSKTRIVGSKVILVPYKKRHVEKYHEWMKSPELQYLTGSESLSLEDEYNMQKSWLEDDDKCTFIILNREQYENTDDDISSMIGDTNLYFNDPDDVKAAECEIMIAEKSARGKKMGWEAMILMLIYGIEVLRVNKYVAKIKMDNETSIQMFKKLQYEEVTRSSVWKEITFERIANDDWIKWLRNGIPKFCYESIDE